MTIVNKGKSIASNADNASKAITFSIYSNLGVVYDLVSNTTRAKVAGYASTNIVVGQHITRECCSIQVQDNIYKKGYDSDYSKPFKAHKYLKQSYKSWVEKNKSLF